MPACIAEGALTRRAHAASVAIVGERKEAAITANKEATMRRLPQCVEVLPTIKVSLIKLIRPTEVS
jgi:hypothetical protein